MLAVRDNLAQCFSALRAHKMRASLTMLGLTMGVATLITVMTIVQGANLYVEQKIANLGTNVFQIARTPFAVTDFNIIIKALKYKKIEVEDVRAIEEACSVCKVVGATASATARARAGNKEVPDVNFYGQTASMADIDTRAVESGRYFTVSEAEHHAEVCLIGDTLVQQLFLGTDPIGKTLRVGNDEFVVVGVMEKIGSVLGQDQDNFVTVPLPVFLRIEGIHTSLTINVKTSTEDFEKGQDQSHLVLRARRHLKGKMEDDFFIGTKESYMSLWRSISTAFFGVFIMVSAISVVIGGIVIMNVMLVSVTLRRREIGVRRAMGATQRDILEQFMVESFLQCIAGGVAGIALGFLVALALRTFTPFPASVQTWVAVLGVFLSSAVGLFFGIYPALRASRLDPVVALRSD
ncbi:MAG TPA: ABC transporter permease [Candidatus Acidoferrum sp.]|nr:ABC transporter permease [Candidatus Acidoferrum sp.]